MGCVVLLPSALLGLASAAEAQVSAFLPEHFYKYEGCYELEVAKDAEWVKPLERRLQLTTVQLAPIGGVVVHQFVARAGPGEPASWYPKLSWLLVGDVGRLQISWEWPMFDWVTAEFTTEGWDGERPLEGEIRHSTDVIGYAPDPMAVRLRRIECASSHFEQR